MSASNSKHSLEPDQEAIYKTVDVLNNQLSAMEKFIARRFDEISMEINATSQQVDMAEDGIARRFSEILEILGAINYSGDGSSAANTGVELEAVIEDTENAANHILDAADRITEYVSDESNWSDSKNREEMRNRIQNDVQEILMACTFQDLTGQRIRNTLNNLHSIEERLSTTFERLGIEVQTDQKHVQEKVKKAHNQAEVDAVFSGAQDSDSNKSASQDDIDGLFD